MFTLLFKSKVFQRYMLSYLIVFFIPFIIMSVYIYHSSVVSLKKEIEQSNINKLSQIRDVTDNRLKEMRGIATRIATDPSLTPYMVSHTYTQIDAIEKLGMYKANNAMFDQIFLYYHNSNNIYSDKGLYSINALLGRVYHTDDKKQFIKTLKTQDTPLVLPAEKVKVNGLHQSQVMTFLYPIPPKDPYKHGVVMYFVKKSVYQDLIQHTLGDFKSNIYIFNKNKELISSASNEGGLDKSSLKRLATSKKGIHNLTFNNEKYSVVTTKSDSSGWTFVTAMPTKQFMGSVIHFKIFLFAILASVVMAGMLLALIFAIRQYKPIGGLIDYVQAKNKAGKSKEELYRFRSVHETIEGFIKNHDQLQARVISQEPYVRSQCLLRLIRGDWEDIDEIKSVCASIGISFPYQHYFVAYITFNKEKMDAKLKEAILNTFEEMTLPDGIGYGIELIHDNALAVVINVMKQDTRSIKKVAQALDWEVNQGNYNYAVIGVGTPYSKINDIHSSFIEASGAVEYKLIGGKTLIYFNDFSASQETGEWYSNDIQIKLVQSLKKGNESVASAMVTEMFDLMKDRHIPIYLLKCYCFDMINLVLHAAADMHYEDPKAVKDIVNFNSVEDLEGQIRTFIHNLCEEVKSKKVKGSLLLHNKMIQYINDHFKEYEFSLERMADHFNLSESYLSRFIKEQTGVNFTRYLWQLRIDEVKRQLSETDDSIKFIVNKVGYVDVPNFTRKFKKTEGITPGQYRKIEKGV
ncbi:AraC family transcriptional regulator [Scopulibacillus darangshiensis]|nr:AraC family transcriptional regulator [Scopulibacillus darangshiensis]